MRDILNDRELNEVSWHLGSGLRHVDHLDKAQSIVTKGKARPEKIAEVAGQMVEANLIKTFLALAKNREARTICVDQATNHYAHNTAGIFQLVRPVVLTDMFSRVTLFHSDLNSRVVTVKVESRIWVEEDRS